jgi:putative transposase
MRVNGIRGVTKAKSPRTTIPAPAGNRPDDLVRRAFTADGPNQLWVADITYIRTFSGWVYAAFVMDMCSRRIVGWQVSTSLHATLALDALEMGLWNRDRTGQPRGSDSETPDLIHHSDRGVQYRAVRYTERLEDAEIVASVGSKGDSYDNAAAEAFNSTFKSELIRNRHVLAEKGPWRSIDDLEIAVAEWIEWYNTTRLHGSLNDVPPNEYEITYYADHARSRPVGATP